MNFSKEWEERFKANTHISNWPWSDLVSYVMRYARPDSQEYRVLELGCGSGANISFFKQLGVQYFSIEGSSSVVDRVRQKFPELKDNIIVGDYTKEIPFIGIFDLIVDRASLSHNTTAGIKNCLEKIHNKLKSGGKFIGIDWFSTKHTDYGRGTADVDFFTRHGYRDGHFADIGRVHFSNRAHLEELFKGFSIEILEHKIITREIPADNYLFAFWNLVARKG